MWQYKPSDDFDLTLGLDPNSVYERKLISRGQVQMQTTEIILNRLKNNAGLILGDEVGMGKTWIALLTAIPVSRVRPVLVLTPSKILSNQWRKQYHNLVESKMKPGPNQFSKLEEYKEQIEVYDDFREVIKDAKKYGKGIFICSIGAVSPTEDYRGLANAGELFDLLILDEGHNFKNEFTLKYQIFRTTRNDRNFKQPLDGRMKRMLILTATPFQLGHSELRGVLSIVEATSAPQELKDNFRLNLDATISFLNQYQNKLAKFEHLFQGLDPVELSQFNKVLESDAKLEDIQTDSPTVNALIDYFNSLKKIKTNLNEYLLQFLVRNSKDKSHREERPSPITLSTEHQLLFFLTEQLGKVKRRHFPKTDGHSPAIASSFGRFEDHLKSMVGLNHHSLDHYKRLAGNLFDNYYQGSKHPKMEKIVDQAFNSWLKSDKTLIFCFYIKTLTQFSELLEDKIRAYIESKKGQILKRGDGDFQTFRNNIGTATNLESLVFRDNLFSVSLRPIIEKNGLDLYKFLKVESDEINDLVRYLNHVNFNPTGANFSKLVAAFTHFAFSKFHRKHKKLIPEALKDDFEYVLDPENVKSLFRKQDRRLDEETSVADKAERRREITTYITNLVNDEQRLVAMMTHPTIWSQHAEQLEKLDVDVRVRITEIISSYLTGDEYLILELLPNFTSRPSADEIVRAYRAGEGVMGESTYQKVCRFLAGASEMAPENLKVLAEEMHFRYNRNKNKVEKIIVETVDGGDSNQDKIRTVTAFRTPFPPYILVTTSVLAEGVDLHTECSHIVHYDHEWNPAALEQKTGRVDRVGSKSDRTSTKIDVCLPYIKHTQDEKAFRVVMARKSWFDTVMGENYQAKWDVEAHSKESIHELPVRVKNELRMELDNQAHQNAFSLVKKIA